MADREGFNKFGKALYDVNKAIGDHVPGENEIGKVYCDYLCKHLPLDAPCDGVKSSYEEEHGAPSHGLPSSNYSASRER